MVISIARVNWSDPQVHVGPVHITSFFPLCMLVPDRQNMSWSRFLSRCRRLEVFHSRSDIFREYQNVSFVPMQNTKEHWLDIAHGLYK